MDYKEEIKKALNKYGEEQYEAGRLQGVYEFYRALKETHETPDEIYERLIKRN